MEDKICQFINKSALYHKRLMTLILERFSLTYAQYQVMKTIQKQDGITAKEILIYLDTDKATLSGVLKRLERAELIERVPNESDKRLVHIHLNESSKALCTEISELEKMCAEDITEGIKPREIRNFLDVFERIVGNQLKKIAVETKKDA